jgi:SAM-dependent methyltransferase/uncharacterized protein YbaR (Trm112 family)
MKSILLDYLVCPRCQEHLECQIEYQQNDEIMTGELSCNRCGEEYKIINGIPRFITQNQPLQGQNLDTARAFGWEWQTFRRLHDVSSYKKQFLDWVHPIQPDFFKEKVILDAGCGMGRFSIVSSLFGAKLVLAVDASDAVEAAWVNVSNYSNIHVIQADINNLPFRRSGEAQIDFIFSIGVLHHLDIPKIGFVSLVTHLTYKGSIFVWVYGKENNEWVVKIINPIRKTLTSRISPSALYVLSWILTLFIQPLLKILYWPANSIKLFGLMTKILPYNSYFAWLSQFGFRHNHHVVFDHLVAPVAFYITKSELESWFQDTGVEILSITRRNQNSWRGHGILCQDHSQEEI